MTTDRPSMRLLLIRHARIDPAAALDDGTPLDEIGRAQAAALVASLADADVTRVFTSPARRARETAELVAGAFGLEAEIDPLLREFELGVEGAATYEEAQTKRTDLSFWRPEHRARADAESLGDFQSRVTALLTMMTLQARSNDVYALVTHAGVIDAALRWAFGVTSTNAWFIEVAAPHASVTEIEHWPRGRHELGAPRYSVLHRVGDVTGLPRELRSE